MDAKSYGQGVIDAYAAGLEAGVRLEREQVKARLEPDLKAATRVADENPDNEFGVGFACGFRAVLAVLGEEGSK